MNDCERIILDELKEIKRDIKALTADVVNLKARSAIWGIIGGAIFTIFTIVIPLVWKAIETPKANGNPIKADTTWIVGNRADTIH